MLTGEVNSALSRQRGEIITQADKGPRATRPFVFHPTLGRTAFEVFPKTIKHRIELLQRSSDAFMLLQARNSFRFTGPCVSHQDAAGPGLTPGRLPYLDLSTRERRTIYPLVFPETVLCLQVNARDRIVASACYYLQLA